MPNENLQASCSAIWYLVLLQASREDQMFSPQVLGTHPWTPEAVLFPASWHSSVLLQSVSSARSGQSGCEWVHILKTAEGRKWWHWVHRTSVQGTTDAYTKLAGKPLWYIGAKRTEMQFNFLRTKWQGKDQRGQARQQKAPDQAIHWYWFRNSTQKSKVKEGDL